VAREQESINLVTVYEPSGEQEYLTAISLLEGAGIMFYAQNAMTQNLFGAGQLGTGFNVLTGAIKIQVAQRDFDEAQKVLFEESLGVDFLDYELPAECPACSTKIVETATCPNCGLSLIPRNEENGEVAPVIETPEERLKTMAMRSFYWSWLWIFGIGSVIGLYYGIRVMLSKNRGAVRLGITLPAFVGILVGLFGLMLAYIFIFAQPISSILDSNF